jgi:hypothetical protein
MQQDVEAERLKLELRLALLDGQEKRYRTPLLVFLSTFGLKRFSAAIIRSWPTLLTE